MEIKKQQKKQKEKTQIILWFRLCILTKCTSMHTSSFLYLCSTSFGPIRDEMSTPLYPRKCVINNNKIVAITCNYWTNKNKTKVHCQKLKWHFPSNSWFIGMLSDLLETYLVSFFCLNIFGFSKNRKIVTSFKWVANQGVTYSTKSFVNSSVLQVPIHIWYYVCCTTINNGFLSFAF